MSTSQIEMRGLPGPGDLVAGKYRIEEILGAGAMGIVVSARHVDLAQPVAIKFLRPEIVLDSSSVARFLREARVAAAVQNEHVARIYDVARLESGTPYLVMERLRGADLDDLLTRRGPLPPAELAETMVQACAAVAEVHAAGIIHRDLKPGNLFITRRGDGSPLVKVLDFGISKFVPVQQDPDAAVEPSLTVDGQFVGSIHYMSPEQLRNPKRVDCRSDIWALGAIMYKLTAGRHAFNADTVVGCIDAIMNAAPEPLGSLRSDVPAELDQVILRCFEKDCARRFQNVAELAEALLPFASPDAQLVARRIRGVLIGSDAIAAETCFMPLGALSGQPDAPAASSPADAAAIAPDVAAGSGAADPDVASPIAVPAFAGPAFAGPAFRRPPKRSSRALLLVAGGSAAVLAIAGVTAWRSLSDQARTPPAVRTVAAPVTEAVRGIAERAAAAEAPALQGDPPGGAASSPTAAGDSSGEPVEAAAAPAKPPAPQGGAVPAAVASTTASKAVTASTGVRASTRKGGGTPVAFKAGATPTKTSRTQPKTAIQSLRKRPGS